MTADGGRVAEQAVSLWAKHPLKHLSAPCFGRCRVRHGTEEATAPGQFVALQIETRDLYETTFHTTCLRF